MKTVHKFPFPIGHLVRLEVPKFATFLKVDVQNGDQPCMWFLVDTDEPKQRLTFTLRGTGHDCEDVGAYVGTFQMYDGKIVMHVFEVA